LRARAREAHRPPGSGRGWRRMAVGIKGWEKAG